MSKSSLIACSFEPAYFHHWRTKARVSRSRSVSGAEGGCWLGCPDWLTRFTQRTLPTESHACHYRGVSTGQVATPAPRASVVTPAPRGTGSDHRVEDRRDVRRRRLRVDDGDAREGIPGLGRRDDEGELVGEHPVRPHLVVGGGPTASTEDHDREVALPDELELLSSLDLPLGEGGHLEGLLHRGRVGIR